MSIYNQVNTYTFRDALTSGDTNKIIKGAYLDAEFGAIHTASLDTVSLAGNSTLTGNNSLTGNTTLGPPASGITLQVTGNSGGAGIAAQIVSTFSSISTSPVLSLKSTAANGFVNLSICGNNGTVGTTDLSLFQNGTNGDATILNRNSGSQLILSSTGSTAPVNINPNGINSASFAPGSGGNAIIGISGNSNSIGFRTVTQTSIGAAGGATALPATPLGYMTVTVNGASVKIPYYNP